VARAELGPRPAVGAIRPGLDPVAVPAAQAAVARAAVLRAAVLEDARSSGLTAGWAWFVVCFPVVGGALVAATIVDKPIFHWLLREDRPVEWAQFAVCSFASAVAVLGTYRLARRRQWAAAVLFGCYAVGLFFLAGEEISWGQRAFAFGEPAGLGSINDQHELTVHNIDVGIPLEQIFEYLETLMSAALMATSLALRGPWARAGRLWAPLNTRTVFRVVSPPLVLIPALAISAVYPWGRFVHVIGRSGAFWSLMEWVELCRYVALAGLAVVVAGGWRTVSRHRRGAPTGSAGRACVPDPTELPLLLIGAACLLLTVVLAVLTWSTGIDPINI
jgi:hypothetical protein